MSYRLLLANLTLALAAGSAFAQEVRVYRANEAVDPRDVAQILEQRTVPGMKMRSLRLLDDAPAQTASTGGPAATAPSDNAESPRVRSAALSLPVQFSFDSADIQPAARAQLDALAQGIRLLPALKTVVIEGHTDAVGADMYNEQLSQRRAYAVKRYLVAQHGIDPARLRAIGLGKYEPLPGKDPLAAENRRVQFRGE
jgi:outer membrane protein OmpA-like peptidoglycan-associated protein